MAVVDQSMGGSASKPPLTDNSLISSERSRMFTATHLTRTAATKAVREIRRLLNALTGRELQILKLMAEGLENHDIAHRLNIAESTVSNHISSVLSKLYAKNRTEAVAVVRREGLIE